MSRKRKNEGDQRGEEDTGEPKNKRSAAEDVPIQPAAAPNQSSAVNNTGQARVGGPSKDVMEHRQPYRGKQED